MTYKFAAGAIALFLPMSNPSISRMAAPAAPISADAPTRSETAAGSAIAYAACGLPPLIIAGMAASYGWIAPVVLAFGAGGAALSLMEMPQDTAQADKIDPAMRATAGAVRGAFLFPVMTGYAGQRAWGGLLSEQIHRARLHLRALAST